MFAPRILAGMAGVALAAAVPAAVCARDAGEASVGSRIAAKPTELDARHAGQIRKDFGRCMYRGYRAKSDAFLSHSDPVSVDLAAAGLDERTLKREFSMETCLGRILSHVPIQARMSFNYPQLRALLAEEAYVAARDSAPKLPADSMETIERTFVSTGGDLVTARANAAFADCVVFNAPAQADAMLRTMPGTTEELAAARALAPALGACLTQGQQLELKADNIRTLVADGLWTRFVRPAGSAPAMVPTGGSR